MGVGTGDLEILSIILKCVFFSDTGEHYQVGYNEQAPWPHQNPDGYGMQQQGYNHQQQHQHYQQQGYQQQGHQHQRYQQQWQHQQQRWQQQQQQQQHWQQGAHYPWPLFQQQQFQHMMNMGMYNRPMMRAPPRPFLDSHHLRQQHQNQQSVTITELPSSDHQENMSSRSSQQELGTRTSANNNVNPSLQNQYSMIPANAQSSNQTNQGMNKEHITKQNMQQQQQNCNQPQHKKQQQASPQGSQQQIATPHKPEDQRNQQLQHQLEQLSPNELCNQSQEICPKETKQPQMTHESNRSQPEVVVIGEDPQRQRNEQSNLANNTNKGPQNQSNLNQTEQQVLPDQLHQKQVEQEESHKNQQIHMDLKQLREELEGPENSVQQSAQCIEQAHESKPKEYPAVFGQQASSNRKPEFAFEKTGQSKKNSSQNELATSGTQSDPKADTSPLIPIPDQSKEKDTRKSGKEGAQVQSKVKSTSDAAGATDADQGNNTNTGSTVKNQKDNGGPGSSTNKPGKDGEKKLKDLAEELKAKGMLKYKVY